MDLQEHKTKLEQELIETTEQAKRLSFKMKELTAKIKKLDKAIANAKEIIGEWMYRNKNALGLKINANHQDETAFINPNIGDQSVVHSGKALKQ